MSRVDYINSPLVCIRGFWPPLLLERRTKNVSYGVCDALFLQRRSRVKSLNCGLSRRPVEAARRRYLRWVPSCIKCRSHGVIHAQKHRFFYIMRNMPPLFAPAPTPHQRASHQSSMNHECVEQQRCSEASGADPMRKVRQGTK